VDLSISPSASMSRLSSGSPTDGSLGPGGLTDASIQDAFCRVEYEVKRHGFYIYDANLPILV